MLQKKKDPKAVITAMQTSGQQIKEYLQKFKDTHLEQMSEEEREAFGTIDEYFGKLDQIYNGLKHGAKR